MTGVASAADRMCWRGEPSRSGKTVRRLSCRAITSPIAACSASSSSEPRSRTTSGMLYVPAPPSILSTNHSRSWAKESGISSGLSITVSGRRAEGTLPVPASQPISAAGVGCSKTVRIASSTPKAARTRLTRRVASSEWPPRSKKLSSRETEGRPRISANSPQKISSSGVRGARPEAVAPKSGAGSARASSLPLVVSGSASRCTNQDGTMWSGSSAAACLRRAAGSGAAPSPWPPTT